MAEEKMNYKLVLTDADVVISDYLDASVFEEFGRVIVFEQKDKDLVKDEVQDADVLFVNKFKIDRELLGENPTVKFISLFATGYDNIDIDYCREKGIVVSNAPAYSSHAVAQHTFALILEHFAKVAKYDDIVHKNAWTEKGTKVISTFETNELFGKTIGLLGYGKIGRQVATIARAFGMDVLVYTRSYGKAKEEGNTSLEGFVDRADKDVTFVTLDNLLKHSDIISIHCPLNGESRGLINAETINKMRKGAFLVNTSRGPIINEKDLYDALVSGKLSGAALDVVETEPMQPDCLLLKAPNCIITPHVAWAPYETRQRLLKENVKNFKAFLAGKPVNVVN